jgi:hypothetical protein
LNHPLSYFFIYSVRTIFEFFGIYHFTASNAFTFATIFGFYAALAWKICFKLMDMKWMAFLFWLLLVIGCKGLSIQYVTKEDDVLIYPFFLLFLYYLFKKSDQSSKNKDTILCGISLGLSIASSFVVTVYAGIIFAAPFFWVKGKKELAQKYTLSVLIALLIATFLSVLIIAPEYGFRNYIYSTLKGIDDFTNQYSVYTEFSFSSLLNTLSDMYLAFKYYAYDVGENAGGIVNIFFSIPFMFFLSLPTLASFALTLKAKGWRTEMWIITLLFLLSLIIPLNTPELPERWSLFWIAAVFSFMVMYADSHKPFRHYLLTVAIILQLDYPIEYWTKGYWHKNSAPSIQEVSDLRKFLSKNPKKVLVLPTHFITCMYKDEFLKAHFYSYTKSLFFKDPASADKVFINYKNEVIKYELDKNGNLHIYTSTPRHVVKEDIYLPKEINL